MDLTQGTLWLFTDGGASPNPGPASIAFLIRDDNGTEVVRGATYIGEATNNVAEYLAFIRGLAACCRYPNRPVHWVSDSELAVNQVSGTWTVRDEKLRPLHALATAIAAEFPAFEAEHRPRTDLVLKWVDALVRKARAERG